jgi:hypothetical protein
MSAISNLQLPSATPRMAPASAQTSCPPAAPSQTAVDRAALKAAIDADLHDLSRAGMSREQLADALTVRGGRQISRSLIDAWAATTKENMIPLDLVDDWADLIGSERIPRLLATLSMRRYLAIGEATERHWEAERRVEELRKGAA